MWQFHLFVHVFSHLSIHSLIHCRHLLSMSACLGTGASTEKKIDKAPVLTEHILSWELEGLGQVRWAGRENRQAFPGWYHKIWWNIIAWNAFHSP